MALADPAAHGRDPKDTFNVIVPSLSGFPFSGLLPRNGVDYVKTSDIWVKLMQELGYKKFVTYSGDAGAFVSARLRHAHSDSIMGVHLSFPILPEVPHDAGDPADFTSKERALIGGQQRGQEDFVHILINAFDPQTLA